MAKKKITDEEIKKEANAITSAAKKSDNKIKLDASENAWPFTLYRLGNGRCIVAFKTGGTVVITDKAADFLELNYL